MLTESVATSIRRIVLLPESQTIRLPAPSLATEYGKANRATIPVPSVLPAFPGEPANVVTAPVAMSTRRVV